MCLSVFKITVKKNKTKKKTALTYPDTHVKEIDLQKLHEGSILDIDTCDKQSVYGSNLITWSFYPLSFAFLY